MIELSPERMKDPMVRATIRIFIEKSYSFLKATSVGLSSDNLKHALFLVTMPIVAALVMPKMEITEEEIIRAAADNYNRLSDLYIDILMDVIAAGKKEN